MKINSLRSLYRVNVRFVATICLLCALAAAGWVAWRLSSWQPLIPGNKATELAVALPSGEWRRSDGQEVAWSEADPFTSPYLEARLGAEAAERAVAKALQQSKKAIALKRAVTRPQPKPQARPTTPPATPNPPHTITLIYRGVLTHIDGTRVAIIDQVENGKTTLMQQGDSIEGFRMAQLDRAAAMLMAADGKTEHALPTGKRIRLIPGKQKQ